ncbi:hypothetical protein BH790_gp60 [Gordonia phage Gsput1]|uniref:Uncharacterized protein n=1 Tax=Gordonia phage Gsput1 TaxID=1622193 RepID=A0A0E3T8B8_9CAUD|nr:hypothetical protein BH790_gp60 [Gordonia phage Gsput1]AKC03085.1 hypothetical protein Gsput1_60 [Gordonia phage Gsput1]
MLDDDGYCLRSDLLPAYCWHCRGFEGSEAERLADAVAEL